MHKKSKIRESSHETNLDESLVRIAGAIGKALMKRGSTVPKSRGRDIVPSPNRNLDRYTGTVQGGRLPSENSPSGGKPPTSPPKSRNFSGVGPVLKTPGAPDIPEPQQSNPKPETEPESKKIYTYLPKSDQMIPSDGGPPIALGGKNIRAGIYPEYEMRGDELAGFTFTPTTKSLTASLKRKQPASYGSYGGAIDTVPMRESVVDVIRSSLDENPLDVQDAVSDIMLNKIRDAVELKKIEMAQQFFDAVPEDGWDDEDSELYADDEDDVEFEDDEEFEDDDGEDYDDDFEDEDFDDEVEDDYDEETGETE